MSNFGTYYSLMERLESSSDSIYADKITKFYLENLDELPKMKRQHFLSRLIKVYGEDPKWMSEIGNLSYWLAKEVENLFDEYVIEGKFEKAVDNFIEFRTSINANTESKKRGNEWVEENRERTKWFLSYLEILMKTNIVFRLKGQSGFNSKKLKEIRSWLQQNWSTQIEFALDHPEIFRLLPVQSVNIFYYMETLGWLDSNYVNETELRFLKTLRGEFTNLEDHRDFNNYLYALTHIIIGKSWFYEYKLPNYREKYEWIIEFFRGNEDRIMSECVPDIVIEIGVIFYICNEISNTKSYKKYTINKLGPNGIIPAIGSAKSERDLSVAEHSNILAIMLLKGF